MEDRAVENIVREIAGFNTANSTHTRMHVDYRHLVAKSVYTSVFQLSGLHSLVHDLHGAHHHSFQSQPNPLTSAALEHAIPTCRSSVLGMFTALVSSSWLGSFLLIGLAAARLFLSRVTHTVARSLYFLSIPHARCRIAIFIRSSTLPLVIASSCQSHQA